jgi:glycosyltransferase involved in cell wall biosynthesis
VAEAKKSRREVRARIDSLYVLSGRYRSLRSLHEIRKILHDTSPDYFHLQQTGDPRFLWVAFRVPTVLTLHEPTARPGDHKTSGLRILSGGMVARIYRRLADAIVVHTHSSFLALSARERRKAVVIPHGVRVAVTAPVADSKTILLFGRAAAYKGIDTLLSAMAKVWQTEPGARLRILASPAHDECRYNTADSRVSATWDGYTDVDLESALAAAHAVCLPYTSASGSGAGAQAYGSGKPIVASDLEGLRELVSDDELLARPGDAEDLARALLVVLNRDFDTQPIDPARTWSRVAQLHAQIYESIVTKRRGKRS